MKRGDVFEDTYEKDINGVKKHFKQIHRVIKIERGSKVGNRYEYADVSNIEVDLDDGRRYVVQSETIEDVEIL